MTLSVDLSPPRPGFLSDIASLRSLSSRKKKKNAGSIRNSISSSNPPSVTKVKIETRLKSAMSGILSSRGSSKLNENQPLHLGGKNVGEVGYTEHAAASSAPDVSLGVKKNGSQRQLNGSPLQARPQPQSQDPAQVPAPGSAHAPAPNRTKQSKSIIKRLSTTFRNQKSATATPNPPPLPSPAHSSFPVDPSSSRSHTRRPSKSDVPNPLPTQQAKNAREAALRERGLLPALPSSNYNHGLQRDLSALEREQDRRLTVVLPAPDPVPSGDANESGVSAADLIKKEWEEKERQMRREREKEDEERRGKEAEQAERDEQMKIDFDGEKEDLKRMRSFRFGGSSPSSPTTTTLTASASASEPAPLTDTIGNAAVSSSASAPIATGGASTGPSSIDGPGPSVPASASDGSSPGTGSDAQSESQAHTHAQAQIVEPGTLLSRPSESESDPRPDSEDAHVVDHNRGHSPGDDDEDNASGPIPVPVVHKPLLEMLEEVEKEMVSAVSPSASSSPSIQRASSQYDQHQHEEHPQKQTQPMLVVSADLGTEAGAGPRDIDFGMPLPLPSHPTTPGPPTPATSTSPTLSPTSPTFPTSPTLRKPTSSTSLRDRARSVLISAIPPSAPPSGPLPPLPSLGSSASAASSSASSPGSPSPINSNPNPSSTPLLTPNPDLSSSSSIANPNSPLLTTTWGKDNGDSDSDGGSRPNSKLSSPGFSPLSLAADTGTGTIDGIVGEGSPGSNPNVNNPISPWASGLQTLQAPGAQTPTIVKSGFDFGQEPGSEVVVVQSEDGHEDEDVTTRDIPATAIAEVGANPNPIASPTSPTFQTFHTPPTSPSYITSYSAGSLAPPLSRSQSRSKTSSEYKPQPNVNAKSKSKSKSRSRSGSRSPSRSRSDENDTTSTEIDDQDNDKSVSLSTPTTFELDLDHDASSQITLSTLESALHSGSSTGHGAGCGSGVLLGTSNSRNLLHGNGIPVIVESPEDAQVLSEHGIGRIDSEDVGVDSQAGADVLKGKMKMERVMEMGVEEEEEEAGEGGEGGDRSLGAVISKSVTAASSTSPGSGIITSVSTPLTLDTVPEDSPLITTLPTSVSTPNPNLAVDGVGINASEVSSTTNINAVEDTITSPITITTSPILDDANITPSPISISTPTSSAGPHLKIADNDTTNVKEKSERRKSLSLFSRRKSTLETSPGGNETGKTSTLSQLKRSVVGSLMSKTKRAKSPGPLVLGLNGGGAAVKGQFDASHLPPSPSIPEAFKAQQQGQGQGRAQSPLSDSEAGHDDEPQSPSQSQEASASAGELQRGRTQTVRGGGNGQPKLTSSDSSSSRIKTTGVGLRNVNANRSSTLPGSPTSSSHPRVAVDPTMHSRGSILFQTSGIEDEESRRVTEVAFLY
ncbi:hypothetical protein D9758_013288 [Tetrapyrgos nigripes]|uniref:Uncharacterized protein n=1 Tax=Tetrapyrgos nigripes TaxID=182062 RepID=A0A8H5CCL3_9AGAR|nr:hypothetical protein D9758_013288 [Tetrapyrgos nigripes]